MTMTDFKELPETKKDLGPSKHVSSFVKGGIGLLATALVDMLAAFSTAYWATWNRVGAEFAFLQLLLL